MKTVLIVDDEAALVRSIATFLESFPGELEVLRAFSGEEGLQILEDNTVDVLLTDVSMPGLDGISLVRRAVAVRPGIRVIVMTAFGSPEVEAVALREGAMRFLDKPVDLEELRSVIQLSAMAESGWAGMVGGLDLLDLAQLITFSGKTAIVHVACGDESGVLVFRERSLVHASTGRLRGEEAFYRMALWDGGTFQEVLTPEVEVYPGNIDLRATHLFMEAARRRDEAYGRRAGSAPGTLTELVNHSPAAGLAAERAGKPPLPWPDDVRAGVERLLAKLEPEPWLLGAAVVMRSGELVARLARGPLDIRALARSAQQDLQALRDLPAKMGFDRADLAFLRSRGATCVLRWLDDDTAQAGGAAAPKASCLILLVVAAGTRAQTAELSADALARGVARLVCREPGKPA
jgi:CheY-like chemotaxis protein